MRTSIWIAWGVAASLAGCGDGGTGGGGDASIGIDAQAGIDGGASDAGMPGDAGIPGDAGELGDGGAAQDAGPTDSGPRPDVGPLCEGMVRGECTGAGVACECCPAGGPLERCLCTTTCTSDADCTDPARPDCNQPAPGESGICAPVGFMCAWGAICASPDTPIATPTGERAIASLLPGELVYSLDHGILRAVPIRDVGRQFVSGHRVVRVTLASGAVIEMSEGHPTADGRFFRDLVAGEFLDGVPIRSVELVPYAHDATYDILPDSETATYVAAGVLVGSTLAR